MHDVQTEAPPHGLRHTDPYRAPGVRPFIDCASVRTGGSLMLPEVRAATAAASRHFGTLIADTLDGPAAPGRMQGAVTLGSGTRQSQGPVNFAQFGPAWFAASRRRPATPRRDHHA